MELGLASLDDAGIAFRLRKPLEPDGLRPCATEVDVWIARPSRQAADGALESVGFNVFHAPAHRDHRFYLAFDGTRWVKLDAKLEDRDGSRAKRLAVKISDALARIRPASTRRLGPVVAVMGPDGAGKGSVIRCLKAQIPVGVTIIYLGRKTSNRRGHRESSPRRPSAATLVDCAFVVRNYVRSSRALLTGYVAAWRGHIVLCDRHPIETLAVRPRRAPIAGCLERLLARNLTPWPDAIVVLDAPAPTLFERKGEHSVEVLQRWRVGYRDAFASRATVVSTQGLLEESVREASVAVWDALSARRRWRNRPAIDPSARRDGNG